MPRPSIWCVWNEVVMVPTVIALENDITSSPRLNSNLLYAASSPCRAISSAFTLDWHETSTLFITCFWYLNLQFLSAPHLLLTAVSTPTVDAVQIARFVCRRTITLFGISNWPNESLQWSW